MDRTEGRFFSSIKENEIKEGHVKPIYARGKPILLAKKSGQIFAVSNKCPHEGCSLERGILREYIIICPCHGWKFDVRSGKNQENNSNNLINYRTKIENGKIQIKIEP